MHLPYHLRERVLRFYTDILGCRKLVDLPYPNVDLYEFQGGFILGLFFYNEVDTLSEKEQLKATWMEIKPDNPVVVLGHPKYYPRFGFAPAKPKGLRSEYDVPDEVFMVAELSPGALSRVQGLVKYRPEFNQV